MNNQEGHVKIDAKMFNSRFSSKREVYKFCTLEVGMYLPDYDQ